MFSRSRAIALLPLLLTPCLAQLNFNFTIANGQIYTPGFAILNAPQPGTPLGGGMFTPFFNRTLANTHVDQMEVSLDVTTNGRMPLPPYPSGSPSAIHNISIFLSSYNTGRNFTITNDAMVQEPGSTVKHVRFTWPDCLVGDGQPTTLDSPRGVYNISIRQNFRLNGENHYTIFDVPISVTNSISANGARPACDSIANPMLAPEEVDVVGANNLPVMFAPGDASVIRTPADGKADGLGPLKGSGASGRMSGALGMGWLGATVLGAVLL
ncbi:hypothetical protein B0T18DRAFT_141258 [Schizothecium vesticola]|uniref:Uncharacterized protein n=1 Tax=Schizothecium vesticola TaxID=314040 RepID=A0AA40EUX9_9PEZI|nr:hypothetical protein B0T18DRAFT_141258 [Schizothecium vesticola]